MAHKAACHTLSKAFFEIDEDMVQILLVLEVLFTQDSEVEDLFCGASSGSEPSLFFSNYFFSLGFKPIQDNFQRARLIIVHTTNFALSGNFDGPCFEMLTNEKPRI